MRVLLLLLLIVSPGCVLTSAANRLSDPTYPEQDAEVAAISSDAVEVVIRGTDGSSERCKVSGFVSRTNEGTTRALGPIRRASVKRAWRRTMHLSPVAIFERREELESVYEVVASDGEAGATREIGILRVPPSTGEKVVSYVLLPVCFVVDLGTFPLGWLGLLIFM